MLTKLGIPLLALAVTLSLAPTPAEARGRGGHGYHGHGSFAHVSHGRWGGGGFYDPFWCPYPSYYGCLPGY